MSISFTTVVDSGDLDANSQAWRVPVLRIPGANITEIFAEGRRIDADDYVVDTSLNQVRWRGRSTPPVKASITVQLTKELSSSELTAKWKKLAIVLPVMVSLAAAIITATVTLRVNGGKARLDATGHEWRIKGSVKSIPGVSHFQVSPIVRPPDVQLRPDWSFEGRVTVQQTADGKFDFPSIILLVDKPGFNSPVIHLLNPGETTQVPNVEDYRQETNVSERVITLHRAIEFKSDSGSPPFRPDPDNKPKPIGNVPEASNTNTRTGG